VANSCLGTDRNISFFRLHQIHLAKITVNKVTLPLLTPFGIVQRGRNEHMEHRVIDVFFLDYTSEVSNETICDVIILSRSGFEARPTVPTAANVNISFGIGHEQTLRHKE
jgi:hypothetical protein